MNVQLNKTSVTGFESGRRRVASEPHTAQEYRAAMASYNCPKWIVDEVVKSRYENRATVVPVTLVKALPMTSAEVKEWQRKFDAQLDEQNRRTLARITAELRASEDAEDDDPENENEDDLREAFDAALNSGVVASWDEDHVFVTEDYCLVRYSYSCNENGEVSLDRSSRFVVQSE